MPHDKSSENLSRGEAAHRAGLIDVESCHVTLDLSGAPDAGQRAFPTESVLEFRARPGAETFLDFVGDDVTSVVLNGEPVEVAGLYDGARLQVRGLAEHNVLEITGRALFSRTGEGLHRFVDPADDQTYLYTQCEPADARRYFAHFDQPDLKARFSFTILAPDDWVVSANGALAAQSTLPGTEEGPAVVRWDFAPTPPMPSYLAAVLAGPYHRVEDEWTGSDLDGTALSVPLAAYCRASLAEFFDADRIFGLTKRGLDFYHSVFAPAYPWGKYEQAFVPEYNLGAMENPGLVTFTEQYVFASRAADSQYEARANTLMHEMAHMWFGDLVTMRWWDDLWLKESFAEFMGTLAVERATDWQTSWVNFANRRKGWAYVQDQLPTTHPIVADVPDLEAAEQNFDGITYAKGASVLRQLVAFVGEEAFFEAAREYFARHAFGNTTLADLLDALSAASGRAMDGWAAAWLQTAGLPLLEPEVEYDGGRLARVALRQTAIDAVTGASVPRPHRLRVGLYSRGQAGSIVRTQSIDVEIEGGSAGELTELPQLTGLPTPDLLLVNDEDLTYAKARLDPASEQTVRASLGDIADPLARALCWTALWHAARDGEVPARDYVRAVAAFGPAETTIGVLLTVLDNARMAIERYTHVEERDALRNEYLGSVAAHLDAAEPGSDHELAWARALAKGSRYGGGQLGRVRALLDDGAVGVSADAELRWSLLQALAAQGQASDVELDDELARDETARGRVGRALAAAARPDARTKRAAWRAVVDQDSLSNELLGATAEGFMLGPTSLRTPYVDVYFDSLERVWSERSNEIASRIVTGLFPGDRSLGEEQAPEDDEVIRLADGWLVGHENAPAALRRLVVEQRDHLHRSLVAQERSRRG
ncbi:aminopeptidase N [Sinomonas sp. ASV322]|uniref:aminopeptidase N n=1 Tax=Sinomonas sp. ASV322 TaxID=3041920 RepID=UPI0027DD8599|nr:aminopeptidase N [Sinomonas sp. ASV322]MDQ4500998.1 aminopeptidase N [Sinomonas sp. ASV322]